MSIDTPITKICPMASPEPRLSAPIEGLRSRLNEEDAVGIELEYENCRIEVENVPYWRLIPDESLRNRGGEFVSDPLFYDQIDDAMTVVETIVSGTDMVATERCGLHVHLNMRPYTVGQVWAFTTLYALLEPTIYNAFAVDRADNIFAVPLWENHVQVRRLYVDMARLRSRKKNQRMWLETPHTCKYSALNFNPLSLYGTLEMRQPYCTRDFTAIRSWVDFCTRLVRQGTEFRDPCEVLEVYEQQGLGYLQQSLLGECIITDNDIQEYAEDAAYMVAGYETPSWEELDWNLTEEVA